MADAAAETNQVDVAEKTTVDIWDTKEMKSNEKSWSERNETEKALYVVLQITKILSAFLLLYLFIISLGLMGSAFKILGGPTAGEVFRNNEIFDNPIAGLVLGILATVLVQSSSTSTSIIISMTAANLIEVKNAIPMIMGANIGTSVTNTIVSIAQIGNKDEYRRAFAGATVHDCFNLLTVAVLLPVEVITGLLKHVGEALVKAQGIDEDTEKQSKVDFLKKITKPVTSRLVQVDKKLVTKVAEAEDQEELDKLLKKSMIVQKRTKDTHLFMDTPMSDEVAGWLLLFVSLAFLSTCLILLVKLLQSIFRGRAAIWMKSLLNLEFKSVPFVADYILLAFGAGITILMQSSSITTSTLTPLVGIGLIKLEKMFPFTVGANIGTTITGILSALASSNIAVGLTVAYAHLFFNLFGTLIWFPIPFMRRVPLAMAKFLGRMAADWTPFPIVYIAIVFGVLPAIFLALSVAGPAVAGIFFALFLICFIALVVVIVLRFKKPESLPEALRKDSRFMPPSLRINGGDSEAAIQEAAAASGNADLGAANLWWQAPFTWGLGWLIIITLLMAAPNNQWADLKYKDFDTREHVGIGAWSVCSAHYTEDMSWAAQPDCTAWELQNCSAMSGCTDSGFSDVLGNNEKYQDAWQRCADMGCLAKDWEVACLGLSCGGSLHQEQCENITAAVSATYTVSYKSQGLAWSEGNICRDVSEFCDNEDTMASVGNFAMIGLVSTILGETALLAYQFLRTKRDMSKVLWASAALFSLGWVTLLVSWAMFAGARNADVTCTVVGEGNNGAVQATGKFGDIIDGEGSISFSLVTAAWAFLTPVIACIVQRIMFDMKNPFGSAADAKPAQQAETDI